MFPHARLLNRGQRLIPCGTRSVKNNKPHRARSASDLWGEVIGHAIIILAQNILRTDVTDWKTLATNIYPGSTGSKRPAN